MPELERFPDPSALFDWLRGPRATAEEKNAVLRAQVGQLADSEARGDLVATILILVLWPGLDAVHERLRRHYRDAPHALASDISARVVLELRRIDLARVTWIAATVIRNVERDLRRELRKARARDNATVPIEAHTDKLTDGTSSALDRVLAVQVIDCLGDDATLVRAVAVEGYTQREAADQLGFSHDTARKRYQRALARARAKS